MDGLILVLNLVTNVLHNVKLVKIKLITVLHVMLDGKTKFQNVHVNLV